MILSGPGNDGLTGSQFPLFSSDVKSAFAPEHKIDLIRFRVAVNPLLLSGLQAVQITEVIRRIKKRDFLHPVIGKADEVVDVPGFHSIGKEPAADYADDTD